eukprot:symbB.v1.2.035580.t1/scaffold4828.1/size34219/4
MVQLAKSWFGDRHLFNDLDHHHGFLHRLDVPSSGLVLLAKTHVAFYDLQVQLHAGRLVREYQVLCHGWLTRKDSAISAGVFWLGDLPSTCGRGRPSRTMLELQKHLQHPEINSLSEVNMRLMTGRKHQIRCHLAHVGHPVVSDMVYQSVVTYRRDLMKHADNCLHRCRLIFDDASDPGSVMVDLVEVVSEVISNKRRLTDVEDAIAKGGNVNASKDSVSILSQAIQAQHAELVKLLLKKRASPELSDSKGVTPLHLATFDGSLEIMKYLISSRANFEVQDCHGQTPFFFVPNRRACVVLWNSKADPNVLNHKGQTPLHLAAHAGLNDAVPWV